MKQAEDICVDDILRIAMNLMLERDSLKQKVELQNAEIEELKRKTGQQFLDMHEDVKFHLLRTFDNETLSNLYEIRNREVRYLVQKYFKTEIHISCASNFKSSIHFHSNQIDHIILNKYFSVLGRNLRTLDLNADDFHKHLEWKDINFILTSINEHVPNIIELTLRNFYMRNLSGGFLNQLQTLVLVNCSVTRRFDNMAGLQNLNLVSTNFRPWPKIRLENSENIQFDENGSDYLFASLPFPTNCFGRLTHLSLNDIDISNSTLNDLINRNQSIQSLVIHNCLRLTARPNVKELRELSTFDYLPSNSTLNDSDTEVCDEDEEGASVYSSD